MHKHDELGAQKIRTPRRRLAVLFAVALTALVSVVGLAPSSPASAVTQTPRASVIMGDWGGFGVTSWTELNDQTTTFSNSSTVRITASTCLEFVNQPGDPSYAAFSAMLTAQSGSTYNYSFIADVSGSSTDRYFACVQKTYN